MNRIHILGASGSGVSTLGENLAQHLKIPVFDCDFYYWKKTDPPFHEKVPVPERVENLLKDLRPHNQWVLSGSQQSWSEKFEPLYTLVVYLYVPRDMRIERLKMREYQRWGDRVLPGGDMHEDHLKFLDWAYQYDEGVKSGRSFPLHQAWLARQSCPVLEIRGDIPLKESLEQVIKTL